MGIWLREIPKACVRTRAVCHSPLHCVAPMGTILINENGEQYNGRRPSSEPAAQLDPAGSSGTIACTVDVSAVAPAEIIR